MAVAKFNWHGTNPNKAFVNKKPPMSAWGEMVYFNATKAENEAAYNALVNHGPVSDFKTKVWNDICAKVYDLCDEWQINDVYRKSAVWSPFIHEPDRAAWEALAKSKWPDWDEYQVEEWVDSMWRNWKPGTFTAWDYNVLYGQWLLPVGLQKFEVQKGQRLKGEYILRLVEIINHWTELSPLTVRFSTSYKWGKKGKTVVLPYVSVDPDYLEMYFTLRDRTRVDDSIQIHITLDLNLLMEQMTIAELNSCPVKSLINFMKLNVKCKIWDKFPIYVNIDLGMEHDGTVSPVMLSPVHLSALWTGIFQTIATGNTAFVLDGFRVFLKAAMSDHVLPGMADAYGFSFSTNHGQHRGTARIRTKRPLPFSALTRHYWGGKVLVEHQGTLLLFMEDGEISFADATNLSDDPVFHAEHTGRIGFKRTIADASVLSAVSMTAEEDAIVYHGKEIEGRVAGAVDAEHRDRFKTKSSQTIQKTPADPITFDGEVRGMLNELDKEMEKRGLNFVRYADDCIIMVGSEMSANRVMRNISHYIEEKLGLKVNVTKSKVDRPSGLKYLGFGFYFDPRAHQFKAKPHAKSVAKFKKRMKELTCRSWGVSNSYKVEKLNQLIRGWINSFKMGCMKFLCAEFDRKIRYRLRMCIWKHWKTPQNRAKNLIKLGIPKWAAYRTAYNGRAIARVCSKTDIQRAISPKRLKQFGLISMLDYYTERCVAC